MMIQLPYGLPKVICSLTSTFGLRPLPLLATSFTPEQKFAIYCFDTIRYQKSLRHNLNQLRGE